MPTKEEKIRQLFLNQGYERSFAMDMQTFMKVYNPADEEKNVQRRADNYAEWIEGVQSGETKPIQLAIIPPRTPSEFNAVKKKIDSTNPIMGKTGIKAAECSNFAYHAMSILLSDKDIMDQYNVCIAGIGEEQNHNVVLLFPKTGPVFPSGTELSYDQIQRSYSAPSTPQFLVVDPWAMAMGYSAKQSLAPDMKDYAFVRMLQKIKLHYQSNNDPHFNPAASVFDPKSVLRPSSAPIAMAKTAPPPVSSSDRPLTAPPLFNAAATSTDEPLPSSISDARSRFQSRSAASSFVPRPAASAPHQVAAASGSTKPNIPIKTSKSAAEEKPMSVSELRAKLLGGALQSPFIQGIRARDFKQKLPKAPEEVDPTPTIKPK